MSYVQAKGKFFQTKENCLQRVRSEGRLKTYESATDSRAWCNNVHDRQKHFVESIAKGTHQSNIESSMPIEALIEKILAYKNEKYDSLKKRTDWMETLVNIYSQLDLTPEQEQQVVVMKKSMQEVKDAPDLKAAKTDNSQSQHKETNRMDLSAEINIHFTSPYMKPFDQLYSDITIKEIVESVQKKPIIGGVVTRPKPSSSVPIPAGYYPGKEINDASSDTNKSSDTFQFSDAINIPEPNIIPDISFSPFSETQSLDESENTEHIIVSYEYTNAMKAASNDSKDSISTQTEVQLQLEDKEAQTNEELEKKASFAMDKSLQISDDSVDIEIKDCVTRHKVEPFIRSPSCPCFNQINIKLKKRNEYVSLKDDKKLFNSYGNLPQVQVTFCKEEICHCDSLSLNENDVKDILIRKHGDKGWLDNIADYLSSVLVYKNVEIIALKDALQAKESFCAKQKQIACDTLKKLETIQNVAEECDELKKKLEKSQEELLILKQEDQACKPEKIGDSQSVQSIESKRYQNLYNNKRIKNKTEQLSSKQKEKLLQYEKIFAQLELDSASNDCVKDLEFKLKNIKEITKERDTLKSKVKALESNRCEYNLEDVEVFKQRSLLLEEILNDRDRLSKQVEQLRGLQEEVISLRKRAQRVDKVEDDLRKTLKDKKDAEEEFDRLRNQYSINEIQLINKKAEADELRSKLACMEHEIANVKCLTAEKERLVIERDTLKRNLDELTMMNGEFENVKKQMKREEVLRAERDLMKSKYENLAGLEMECDVLRAQVDKVKNIEIERNNMAEQIKELQICITEQESEIRRLVGDIDQLAKGRDEQEAKLKDVIKNLRSDLEQKDILIKSAEEKLADLQKELSNSITGLSSETTDLKMYNEKLETSLRNCEAEKEQLKQQITAILEKNESITLQLNELANDNNYLLSTMEQKDRSLNNLKEILQDQECMLNEYQNSQNKDLESTRTNYEKHSKINTSALSQELLTQLKKALQKVSSELEKHFDDWDSLKTKLKSKGKKHFNPNSKAYNFSCFTISDFGMKEDGEKRRFVRAKRRDRIQSNQVKVSKNEETESGVYKQVLLQTETCQNHQVTQTGDYVMDLDIDEDVFESARGVDCHRCRNLEERLQIIEKELLIAYEKIAKLEEKKESVFAENNVLRAQINEIQEAVQQQIKEFIQHLEEYKEKCNGLEKEINLLSDSNYFLEKEKNQALNELKETQNQKEELEKNISLGTEMTLFKSENKSLKEQLKKVRDEFYLSKEENFKLREILAKVKYETNDALYIKSLRKRNEKLTQKFDEQFKDLSLLLDKIKTQQLPQDLFNPKIEVEKLSEVSKDLEHQLKHLDKINSVEIPTQSIQNTINNLIKRLAKTEKRADLTESALNELKTTDPVIMLNKEINSLREKINNLKDDNSNLSNIITEKNDEIKRLNDELLSKENENNDLIKQIQKVNDENNKINNEIEKITKKFNALNEELTSIKDELDKIQNENTNLKYILETMKSNEETNLRKEEDDKKSVQENEELRKEVNLLKKELDNTQNSSLLSSALISELQNEIADLKQCKIKLEQLVEENRLLNERKNELENKLLKDVDVDELKSAINKLENENKKLKRNITESLFKTEQLNCEIIKFKDNEFDLNQQIRFLHLENTKLKIDLESVSILPERDSINRSNENDMHISIMNEVEKWKHIAKKLKDNNKKLDEIIENQFKENECCYKNLSIIREENSDLNAKIRALQDEIQNNQLFAAEDRVHLLTELIRKNEMLEKENEMYKIESDYQTKNQNTFASLNTQIKILEQRINNVEFETGKIKKECGIDCNKFINKTSNKLAEKLWEIENDCRDLKVSLGHIANKSTKCDETQNQDTKIKQQLDLLEIEKQEALTYSESIFQHAEKGDYDALKSENTKFRNVIKCLESDILKLKEEIYQIMIDKNKVIELENNISILRKEVSEALKEAKQYNELSLRFQNEIENKNQQITNLQTEISDLNQKLSDESLNIVEENNDINELSNKITAHTDIQKLNLALIENRNLKLNLKKALDDNNDKLSTIKNIEENNRILKERIADLERINIDANYKMKQLEKRVERVKSIQDIRYDNLLTDQEENDFKTLQGELIKTKTQLSEAVFIRDKFKNLLENQKTKYKDIKEKIDQVEQLISVERSKCKQEKNKNKDLEEKIKRLSEKLQTSDTKMQNFVEKRQMKEDKKLDEKALSRKISLLEAELNKKQNEQEKVASLQFAVKIEKQRLQELKNKLEEEKIKNTKFLSRLGLRFQNLNVPKSEPHLTTYKELMPEKLVDLQICEYSPKTIKKDESKLLIEPKKLESKSNLFPRVKSRKSRYGTSSSAPVRDISCLQAPLRPTQPKQEKRSKIIFGKGVHSPM